MLRERFVRGIKSHLVQDMIDNLLEQQGIAGYHLLTGYITEEEYVNIVEFIENTKSELVLKKVDIANDRN